MLFLPPPDFGNGPKIGGGSWQWGISRQLRRHGRGALDYMKFAAPGQVRRLGVHRHQQHPGHRRRGRARSRATSRAGRTTIFREYSKKFAVLRPVTPGYPFIATEFTKTAQDILNGADPKTALDQAVKDIDANQESNNYFQ